MYRLAPPPSAVLEDTPLPLPAMSSLDYDRPQPEHVEPTQTNGYPCELELLDSTYACAVVAPMEEHAQRANDLQNW